MPSPSIDKPDPILIPPKTDAVAVGTVSAYLATMAYGTEVILTNTGSTSPSTVIPIRLFSLSNAETGIDSELPSVSDKSPLLKE